MEELENDLIVLAEIPRQLHGELFDSFIDEIIFIVRYENHPYKFRNQEQVVKILNRICQYIKETHGTSARFYINNKNKICMESNDMANEVCLLPHILKQFRKCYRCAEKGVRCSDRPG